MPATTAPSPSLHLLERAEDALARHDPARAAALFRRVVALEPAQAGTLYILGQALRDLGRGDEGGAWRRRAFLTDPAALPTANHRLGLAFARAGRTGPAVGSQLQALDQNPGHAAAASTLKRLAAESLSTDGGWGAGGMDGGLWTRTGHAAFRLGAFAVAEGAFRQAAAAAPDDPAPYRYRGDALSAMDSYAVAATAFAHAVQLAPDHGEHRHRLADTLFRLGRPADAERHLTRALALAPSDAGLWADLGLVSVLRRNGEQALPVQARSIRLAPDHGEHRRRLADTLFRLGRPADAERHLTRALALAPSDAGLWADLGLVPFFRRNGEQALPVQARSVRLAPEAGDHRRCLADTLFLLDRTAEAERRVGGALALDPGAAILWTNLGHTRFRRRDYAGAAAAFARALTLTPGAPDLGRFRTIATYRHLNARVIAGDGDDSGTGHA